jgi:hypothetical protein
VTIKVACGFLDRIQWWKPVLWKPPARILRLAPHTYPVKVSGSLIQINVWPDDAGVKRWFVGV